MTRVNNFMMSFVRCPIRATRRSNEPRVDSFASRAASTACVTRLSMAANRSAEVSVDSRSSSGWARATITSRCGASARRSVPIERRSSTSRASSSATFLGMSAMTLRVKLLQFALDLLEGAEVAGDDPIGNRRDK